MDFPGSSAGKESACNAGDSGSIPGLGRCRGKGTGYPLQNFCTSLVAQMVKNPPACGRPGIPGLGRSPGGEHGNPLQYSYLENLHGQRSLAGYSPWSYRESGMTLSKHSRAPLNISKIYILLRCTQSIYWHRPNSAIKQVLVNFKVCSLSTNEVRNQKQKDLWKGSQIFWN